MKSDVINMIAPCGMNCSVCIGFLREKNKCIGCLASDEGAKPHYCIRCSIKHCAEHQTQEFIYCFDCQKFPCTRLKQLNKRYVTKYKTSLIENLHYIQTYGLDSFIKAEEKKWTCPNCRAKLSIHRSSCLNCNYQIHE